MREERTEGVVIKCVPLREHTRLITLFTAEHGLLPLIVKGVQNRDRLLFTTPFCQAEFLFTKRRSDLFLFHSASFLELHLPLRDDLRRLLTAGDMVKALLKTQLPGKPNLPLYLAFTTFLKKLGSFSSPDTLLTAFYLKLLHHEGQLAWDHTPPPFSSEEWEVLKELGTCKSFTHMQSLSLPDTLKTKTEALALGLYSLLQ